MPCLFALACIIIIPDHVDLRSKEGMKGHECPNHLSTLAADSFECF